ncbi:MAG: AI-2E family transporter [Gemmatimonadota bacterium]
MRHRGVRHAGRIAWSVLGILVVVALTGLVLRQLALVVVPLVIALFPATLLVPVSRYLERWKFPRPLAAGLTLLGGIIVLGGVAAGAITLVVSGAPELAESAGDGIERIEGLVGRVIPGFQVPARDEILGILRDSFVDSSAGNGEGQGSDAAAADEGGAEGGAGPPDTGLEEPGNLFAAALNVTMGAAEMLTGVLLMLVILFFYLRSGRSLAEGTAGFLFPGHRERIMEVSDGAWCTLGAYFRGQLLVAFIDGVLVGVALILLGVPMALPLGVIVFFGGLFPIIGAVITGGLAVLVAFAHGGLGIGLAVAGIVLAVQQLEGNVVAPLILSEAIDLQPLTVILAITLGTIVLGVFGAFLAVPVAAIGKQVVLEVRGEGAESSAQNDKSMERTR